MNIALQVSGHLNAYDYEDITADATNKGFTAAKIEPATTVAEKDLGKAKLIRISIEGDQARFREDPNATSGLSSSVGHLLNVGDYYYLSNLQQMKNFRITRVTTNATVRVTYFR